MAKGRWYTKLSRQVVEWFRYYVVFCKEVAFISALIFSHEFVEKGVVDILVWYLEDQLVERECLLEVAAIMNVQYGLSEIMMMFIFHVSDTWTGHFQMVLYSSVAYVIGFVLLYISALYKSTVFFYSAMVPIAAGVAGQGPALVAFLEDQMAQKEPHQSKDEKVVQAQSQDQAQKQAPNEEQAEARAEFWSRMNKFLGCTVALLVLGNVPWKESFIISAIAITISGSIFCCGFPYYYYRKPTDSFLTDVFQVFKAAIANRHLDYPAIPERFYCNDKKELELLPHVEVLRWLDKAAIEGSPEEQEDRGMPCPVAKVKKVKRLLTMAPLWTTFLVYCLVEATGSTFFFLQTSNMVDEIGGIKAPVIFLSLISSVSSFAASFLYKLIIQKLGSSTQQNRAWKVRIGLGMFCCLLSCIAARSVEIRRLKLYRVDWRCLSNDHNQPTLLFSCGKKFVDSRCNTVLSTQGYSCEIVKETVPMSILWLTPQFCLLGVMEGLCEDGLLDFYYTQVADSMKRYGPPFIQFVLGMGEFISVLWILTFKNWFGPTIYESRLDNYYAILAMLCLANQCFYQYISNLPIYNIAAGGRDDVDELEEIGTDGAENHEQQSSIPPSHPSIPTSTQMTRWTKVRKLIHALKFGHEKRR